MKVFSCSVDRTNNYTLLETDAGDVRIFLDGKVEYHEDDGDGDCEWVKLDPQCGLYKMLRNKGFC